MAGYGATIWVNDSEPALSAANLNKIEAALLAALGYDSSAALRAAGRPTAVQTVQTRGGAALGDGLGGWWYWDSGATDTDDGATVLLPDGHSGAGRWRRLVDQRGVTAAVPAGTVWPTAAETADEGWYLCQGQAVSRTTDAALFARIGTTYGAGNGTTTFNLPDLRDRVAAGASATHARGATYGAATATPEGTITVAGTALTTAQLPAHNHGVTDPGHAHGVTDPGHRHSVTALTNTWAGSVAAAGSNAAVSTLSVQTTSATTGVTVNSATTGITTQSAGQGATHAHTAGFSGTAMSVLPPTMALNYQIKR